MDETNWIISLVAAFLPFAVFSVLVWWLGHQIRRGLTTKDGRSMADVFDEIAKEMKRRADR